LRYAGWKVTDFPFDLVNVSDIWDRPECKALLRAL
jgi:hypothetical protein